MDRKYKELFKNTGLLAISNFSSKILIFLMVPIYTRALTTSEYGFYDLTYTTIQLLFPILTLDIYEGVMRFMMKDHNTNRDIFSIGLIYTVVGSGIFGIGIYVAKIFNISKNINDFSWLIWFYFVTYALNNLMIQFAKGMDKVLDMAIAGLLGTLCMVLGNIYFLLISRLGLKGFYWANILGQLVPTSFLVVQLKSWRYLCIPQNKVLIKQLTLYTIPLILNTLGWWANNTSDRYIVSAICGVDANGLISVAYKIPNIITAIGAIFLQAWNITVVKEYENNKRKISNYSNLFFVFNALFCLISAILIIGNRFISSIIFANDFYTAWKYVPFLIISSLVNTNAGFLGPFLSAEMNSGAMAKSALAGIIINIALNIILTISIGPIGITIATAVASVAIYYIREKYTKGVIRSRNYKNIVLSWSLLVVISCVSLINNRNLFFINLLLLGILLFIYRKALTSIIRIIREIIQKKPIKY